MLGTPQSIYCAWISEPILPINMAVKAQESNLDPLTNLPNRICFLDRLSHSLCRAKRHPGRIFAVLFIDLDRFKMVNEGLSHMVGDSILKDVGSRVQGCLRAVDTVGRFGADEFTVLLEEIGNPMDVISVVERIRMNLIPPIKSVGYETFVSASIGVVLGAESYVNGQELIRDAEIAMMRAKSQGPGRFAIFDPKMQEQAAARLLIEADLRRAIDQNQFQLHYQPIISLETGKLFGMEALIRWLHPRRGLLTPAEFLPIAEETDLIIPISKYVLQAVCSQLRLWQNAYSRAKGLNVSINLSNRVLAASSLPQELLAVTSASGIDPHNLTVEITENQLIDDPASVMCVLEALNVLGTRIAIDDFGTGYSSLSYLATLPAQILKIDQSFISKLPECEKSRAIVRSILSLGSCLGLDVVAEGVETEKQLMHLRELKCGFVQGHYFARPMEATAMDFYIKALMMKQ